MELISQHTKRIMEDCKVRAREAGLQFTDESLEYIVTNRDMLELSPKGMIPTMYDYWVQDIEVLKQKEVYKLYPNNPYETVINSRPPISFYNDNNPDWLNTMIFYHVLGHIDFFQNNVLFQKTWNDDFVGQALADKRLLDSLRSEYGRWTDYVVEFSRSIDNIVSYFDGMTGINLDQRTQPPPALEFYFSAFLQEIEKVPESVVFNEIEHYNNLQQQHGNVGEALFMADIRRKYPEFEAKFSRYRQQNTPIGHDILQFLSEYSPFLQREENRWMKSVMSIVRSTALYFAPQIRSKTINEGWASYWHDALFTTDHRIKGFESEYAKINAMVTSVSRVGLNPYAIGLRLIQHIENLANKGRISYEFQKILGIEKRENFDTGEGRGKEAIFNLRKHFSDFMLINTFVSQEFVDDYNLFVVGKRLNQQRGVYEYYVKSRKAEDYKQMLINSLYHPPFITVDLNRTNDKNLYLVHQFEGKQLYKDFIPDTLIGIEFLWGNQVQLETTDILLRRNSQSDEAPQYEYRKTLYTVKDRQISKSYL